MEEEKKEIGEASKKSLVQRAGGFVRMALKVILYIILGFFVLNSALYITLSVPFIQNRLISFASDQLSTMLKTEVTVSEVRFSLFNRASLKGLYVEDLAHDTLVYAKLVDARIKPLDLILHNRVRINQVQLNDFYINITAEDSISDYNFQFLIDEFSGEQDTTVVDTTSSSLDVVLDDVKITNGRITHRIKSVGETPNIFNPSDIYVTDFNASVSVHSIDMEKLNVHVNNIVAKEKTGIEITALQGHVLSEGSRLWVENLKLTLPHSHLITESIFYDLETEEFELITDDTEVSPKDLIPFMPNFKYFTHDLSLKTTIRGKLPSIDAEKILLTYGNDALLDGKGFITSYEDLENADIGLDINRLNFTPKGITTFAKLGDETFEAPAILDSLGRINLEANLKGKLSKLHLNTKATMNTGFLSLVADGGIDTTFTSFDIKARLSTQHFNLTPIVGKASGIGKLSMHIDLDANQKGEGNLVAKVKGAVDSLDLMHGQVKALPFAAYYDKHKMGFGADAKLHFGHIMAGFEMSSAKKPDIKFAMRIQDFDVAHFYKNKLWDKPMLSFDLKGDINKFDIDDLNANIGISKLEFVDKDFDYIPGPIDLKAWKDTASVKYISLTSSILSANVKGDYKFSTLSDEFSGLMHDYLSNVFPEDKSKIVNANDFVFDITVHNSEELGYIFDLPVDIIEPLVFDGIINTKSKTIDIVGMLPLAQNASMDIQNVRFNVANMDSAFNIKFDTDILMDESTYDLALSVKGADNSVRSIFTVDSDSVGMKINGKIDAMGQFTINEEKELVSFFQVIPSDVLIGNFAMNILPAKVINMSERTEISNLGIGINRKKYLNINGAVSSGTQDSLRINFSKAQIADILQGININDIYAEIDGNILVTNIFDAPEFYTRDLKIADITLYKDTIGTVNVDTRWNQEMGGIKLLSSLTQKGKEVMDLEGLIDPSKETIDLHMDVERFSIAWLKPFMEGLLTDISGDISSHLTIKGTFDEPITEGFLGFNNAKIGVDYTNVTYFISDTIDITPERIGFDNLILKDSQGNQGRVNARVTHRNFKNMKYTLDMRATNLMVLNTQSRTDSLFYGKLFASGTVKIEGSDNGIDLNLQLKNGKKSNLNVTIPQVSEASEYKSVVYINVPEDKLPKEDDKKKETRVEEPEIPIRIKMKLDVDPELELAVVIDPLTGDRMNIKGKGTINFNYDLMTENMTVYGDYNATDGGVRLNLQNISKLEFKIKEGSKLDFIGDPFKTKFNITAYRRVRADLRTLDQSFELDNTSPRVQVDCLLGISGDINKMDLTYDVELYEASDDQARKVKSLVNTDEQRIKQFAYLIASGTFYSSTGGSGANFSDGMWTNLASSALSSGLNSVFGNMLGENWEIGTDFSSNDGTFSDMDMSVNATTRLFDDKLKLHANVGYRSEGAASADDSFIGDFDVEYMLNTTWTLKAYSHTNDRFYRQAPTTQGVGIVFTREGPTFKQMFKSFRRRRGAWSRQNRDSIQRTVQGDSIAVERPRRGHQTPAVKADSVTVAPIQSDSLPKQSTDSKQEMPMVVFENKQPAIAEEKDNK